MPASLPRLAQKYAKEWLEELVRLEKQASGNQASAGKLIGLDQSRVSSVMKTGKTRVEVFLRLAMRMNRLHEALEALGVPRDTHAFDSHEDVAAARERIAEQKKLIAHLERENRAVISIIDALFWVKSRPDKVPSELANERALAKAIEALGGTHDDDEREAVARIGRRLLDAGRVDSEDGWRILLTKMLESRIAEALINDANWNETIAVARMLPPGFRHEGANSPTSEPVLPEPTPLRKTK
jgi:predicted XRE-type DNA-binding protein